MESVVGGGIDERSESATQRVIVFRVQFGRDFFFPVGDEVAERPTVYQVEPFVGQTPPIHRKVRHENQQRPSPSVDARPRRRGYGGGVDCTVDGTLPRVAGFIHRHPFILEQIVSDEMADYQICEEVIHNSLMPNKPVGANGGWRSAFCEMVFLFVIRLVRRGSPGGVRRLELYDFSLKLADFKLRLG